MKYSNVTKYLITNRIIILIIYYLIAMIIFDYYLIFSYDKMSCYSSLQVFYHNFKPKIRKILIKG